MSVLYEKLNVDVAVNWHAIKLCIILCIEDALTHLHNAHLLADVLIIYFYTCLYIVDNSTIGV